MISIIVPVYRVEKYLQDCIESLLSQSFKDIEVILVDDGSDDKCGTICDEYACKDSRINVVHKSNGGLVSARKAGAALATGDYILNVDGDDYIDLDLVKRIVDKIISYDYPDVVVYGYKSIEDNSNRIINTVFASDESDVLVNDLIELSERYLFDESKSGLNDGSLSHTIWSKAIKRELYIECQDLVPNSISKGEDTAFTLFLLFKCHSLLLTDIVGYCYRVRQASINNAINYDDFDKLDILIKCLKNAAGSEKKILRNIDVYKIKRIMQLITRAAVNCARLTDFTNYAKSVVPLIDNASFYFISQRLKDVGIKNRIKLFLLKHRMWKVFYILTKI